MKHALLLLVILTSVAMAAERPNIVVVLVDDLGYGDLACYGSKDTKTPNLDKFATEGLKFTSCYAGHGNCSPSRARLDSRGLTRACESQ
jgi:arylsulfatase A